jgi:hypothetical protein
LQRKKGNNYRLLEDLQTGNLSVKKGDIVYLEKEFGDLVLVRKGEIKFATLKTSITLCPQLSLMETQTYQF